MLLIGSSRPIVFEISNTMSYCEGIETQCMRNIEYIELLEGIQTNCMRKTKYIELL